MSIGTVSVIVILAVIALALLATLKSLHSIGPAEVGLVTKRIGRKLEDDQLVALNGEAGYQADLLMPGLRFKLWPIYKVERYDWVQVPPDHIGLVIAQVGGALPTGRQVGRSTSPSSATSPTSARSSPTAASAACSARCCPPGTTAPIHPVGFVVLTSDRDVRQGGLGRDADADRPGRPDAPQGRAHHPAGRPRHRRRRHHPRGSAVGRHRQPHRRVQRRHARWRPATGRRRSRSSRRCCGPKNDLHDNYQDYQAFLDNGGCIGLQHDPLLYGSYLLNPFLVKVELREMLVVRQGEVAVIKSYVGLPTEDTSGEEFKFGSIVKPGHQGIWSEPLRTGKYTLNPRIYEAEIVPTSILTLNWSHAHQRGPQPRRPAGADRRQEQGGVRLQHRPAGADPRARHAGAEGHQHGRHDAEPRQRGAAVGGRQLLPQQAADARRHRVHREARRGAERRRGVHPAVPVALRGRDARRVHPGRHLPGRPGRGADQPGDRRPGAGDVRPAARRPGGPRQPRAAARRRRHAGASWPRPTSRSTSSGRAPRRPGPAPRARPRSSPPPAAPRRPGRGPSARRRAAAEEALGLARAKGFDAQRRAIGAEQTALVAALREVGNGHVKIVPDIQVGGEGGVLGGLGALLMRSIANGDDIKVAGNGADPALPPPPRPRRDSRHTPVHG